MNTMEHPMPLSQRWSKSSILARMLGRQRQIGTGETNKSYGMRLHTHSILQSSIATSESLLYFLSYRLRGPSNMANDLTCSTHSHLHGFLANLRLYNNHSELKCRKEEYRLYKEFMSEFERKVQKSIMAYCKRRLHRLRTWESDNFRLKASIVHLE